MSKGIIGKYECPACENVIQKKDVISEAKLGTKYTFEGPAKCPSCGHKGKTILLTFAPATVQIVPDNEVENV